MQRNIKKYNLAVMLIAVFPIGIVIRCLNVLDLFTIFLTSENCFIYPIIGTVLSVYSTTPLPPIGLWRDHLPYTSAIDVAAGNENIYCATPYSVFSITTR